MKEEPKREQRAMFPSARSSLQRWWPGLEYFFLLSLWVLSLWVLSLWVLSLWFASMPWAPSSLHTSLGGYPSRVPTKGCVKGARSPRLKCGAKREDFKREEKGMFQARTLAHVLDGVTSSVWKLLGGLQGQTVFPATCPVCDGRLMRSAGSISPRMRVYCLREVGNVTACVVVVG